MSMVSLAARRVDMSTNILPIISYDTGWVDGYLTTSGSIGYDKNGDMTSPFCEVVSGAVRYVVSFSYDLPSPHPGWIAICFYNSSKSKISDRIVSESSASSIPPNITGYVPSGTAYIRVCSSNLADGTNVSASCVMSFAWYVDEEDNLTNDELQTLLPPMQKPYPLSLWRVKSGHLINGLLVDLLPRGDETPPEPVKQRPYISVYDVSTPQDGFENNGLAVLQPSQCLVTEVLNGEYTASLTHPIDAAGKWNYILERNLLKIGGQIFTIVRTDDEGINSQGQIIADCEHVFYQLSDPWIFPGAAITGERGLDLITSADAYMWRNAKPGQVNYYFTYWSDVPISPAVSQLKWNPTQEGMTLIDVILGSNGVAALCGGELYRDNFYFSLNQSMENSEENAFDIHIGFDLTGIRRVFDTSNFCTYFRAYDQYGQWFAVAWAMPAVLRSYSHEIIRSKNFTYNIDEDLLPEGMDIYDASMELLVADGMAYFNKNCAPVMSYTVNIKDVINNPEYAELSGKPRYKVGNVGRVYDARLGGYVTLKITKTVTDAITGEVVQVVFGDLVGFGQPKPATPTAIVGLDPDPQGSNMPLRDKTGEALYDVSGEILEGKVR